jgi:hypothetical protein
MWPSAPAAGASGTCSDEGGGPFRFQDGRHILYNARTPNYEGVVHIYKDRHLRDVPFMKKTLVWQFYPEFKLFVSANEVFIAATFPMLKNVDSALIIFEAL